MRSSGLHMSSHAEHAVWTQHDLSSCEGGYMPFNLNKKETDKLAVPYLQRVRYSSWIETGIAPSSQEMAIEV